MDATGQALFADAAHAYCALFLDCARGEELHVGTLFRQMLDAHEATTPSPGPASHVIVERTEIERLRAIERRTRIAAEMVWSEVPDGYQDGYHDAATQILDLDE